MISRLRPFGGFGVTGLGGDALVNGIADAITQMEGYIPPNAKYPQGSLAYQNNNPGNIRFARSSYNYPGATQGAGGFARYPSLATGRSALEHQIQVQINAGQNLTQFFNQYAPSFENNTPGYIAFVANQVGVDPAIPLKNYQNGSAQFGQSSPTLTTPDPLLPFNPSDDSSSTPSDSSNETSITDSIANADPIMLGTVAVLTLGVMYVLFG